MHDSLLCDVGFWRFLLDIDCDFAMSVREKGCSCGGHLHAANYFRKPRGGPDDLSKECCLRLSLCCGKEGCRKRRTPPSVRFLGPKVYLLPVIFLAAAMRQGPSPRAMRELSDLVPAFDVATLPRSLLQAFFASDDLRGDWERLLRFLAPITIAGELAVTVRR